jgi:hypothetical protein
MGQSGSTSTVCWRAFDTTLGLAGTKSTGSPDSFRLANNPETISPGDLEPLSRGKVTEIQVRELQLSMTIPDS